MKVAAIITEYNPFHQGHAYQLSQIDADYIVVIMSGNYVQRGESALLDKWTRTEMALQNGVDLVLELPVSCAGASAEYFGSGAVFLLEQSQIVNALYFGAEHPDISALDTLARLFLNESQSYSALLKQYLKHGNSFAAARHRAIETLFPNSEFSSILNGSNNILAIEYLKALHRFKSSIRPILIQRKGQNYLDSEYSAHTLLSATAIRKLIFERQKEALKDALPKASFDKICSIPENAFLSPDSLYAYMRFLLTTRTYEDWKNFEELSPELFNRLCNALSQSAVNSDYNDFLNACSSRNFPLSKIKRTILHLILNIPKPITLTANNSYLRVLGFRQSASELLRHLQKSSRIPVITNTRNASALSGDAVKLYKKELECDRFYNEMLLAQGYQDVIAPEKRNPVIIKDE